MFTNRRTWPAALPSTVSGLPRTTFTLPSGSSGATLTINDFYTDDRAVLYVNGVPITGVTWSTATAPNTGVVYNGSGVGTGPMDLSDGSQTSYNGFLAQYQTGPGVTFSLSGANINYGGSNTLTLVVNNTNGGILKRGSQIPGIRTSSILDAQVNYSSGRAGTEFSFVPVDRRGSAVLPVCKALVPISGR